MYQRKPDPNLVRPNETIFDVRAFGARGNGRALDSNAINAAIAAAADAAATGGGIVVVPAGRYLCFSLRLRSRVTLVLAAGATVVAADPARHPGRYDPPEPRADELFQDFGHSHWHNSLLWGVGLQDVAILGPGVIDGAGLTRDGPGARWRRQTGERPLSMAGMTAAQIGALEPEAAAMVGRGNKAIALRDCARVQLADFSVLRGGHFAILASGVDDLSIEGLTIDTGRDGIDLDCVRRARVRGCRVNTPNDDAIVLKSSHALGTVRPCEDVVVEDCTVSGYDVGTMIEGTRGRVQQVAPDRDRVTGRIKLGTESNGDFRNIVIRDCRFERSRGLALEMVDGGVMENVTVSGLTMTEVTTAPLFVRLGDRRRGPEGTGVGAIRSVTIEGVDARDIDPRFAAGIIGLPQARIEDVTLRDVRLRYGRADATICPVSSPPLLADAYPEPSMFGVTPAWGLWMRDAENVRVEAVRLERDSPDDRPATWLERATLNWR